MTTETLPRPFGRYSLTAALGSDALGRVYRAVRLTDDRPFVLLRMLETDELPAESILDAIEESGEVHEFLKHAAIARGVDMDAVDGVPYIAWIQQSGRTLDALLSKCRVLGRKVPVEHALLIAEKVATALDHAYNTTIDDDRTLHGLLWPGFVTLSDDGETRLAGFGLAPGILPAIRKPRLAAEIGPYVAPEVRERGAPGKNSDVYSVGVLLLALLAGPPIPPDPFAAVKGLAGAPPPPVAPEILAVLRMALAPADARYKTSGDLRRELGKLLFSGPYSPSTFNLAYFLNELFRKEIENESRARLTEGGRDAEPAPPAREPPRAETRRLEPPADGTPGDEPAPPRRRGAIAAAGALVVAAAIAGGVYVVARRQPAAAPKPATPAAPLPVRATPTLLPELAATPAGPTSSMSEADFREEVARRLAVEVQKLEAGAKARTAREAARTAPSEPEPAAAPVIPVPAPTAAALAAPATPAPVPTDVPIARAEPPALPTAVPAPVRPSVRAGALVALEEVDRPPRVARVVKPAYPPLALQARIGGIVILRVLVSEQGAPAEIEVLRPGRAGLTESAVRAVKEWTFEPASKDGVPVRTWISVPIPFEP